MQDHTTRLQAVQDQIGPAVLVPVIHGTKQATVKGWTELTFEDYEHQDFQELFKGDINIGVLLGCPSQGLCTIDLDDDNYASCFTELNPILSQTLQTKGARGRNFWVRIIGEYPSKANITLKSENSAVGEWRADRNYTIIGGKHPSGCNYRIVSSREAKPVEIEFHDIVWPLEWSAPFLSDLDGELEQRYGPLWMLGNKGKLELNQIALAARFAAERRLVWEQDERQFYLYNEDRGLWIQQTTDHIKTLIGSSLLSLARQAKVPRLITQRNNALLNSLTDLLRGLTERREPFSQKNRGIIHLRNGMLDITTPKPELLAFNPNYWSRNQTPLDLDENAGCEQFLDGLLRQALPEDDIDLLQRWCGAVLLGGNYAQRILLLTGTAGGGKSTLVDILETVMGPDNVIEMRPNQLNERFEIGRYIGKRLLAGKDVAGNFLETSGASALKKLTGHDYLSCERKNSNLVFSIRGMFDAVVTCNSRMRLHLDGDVDAWRRRLMVIRYERPKPKVRIERFAEKLLEAEGKGILVWMLQGARRHMEELHTRGDFLLTTSQTERVASLLNESDSVRVFVQNEVVSHPSGNLTTDELVAGYNDFCVDQRWQPRASREVERLLVDLMMEIHRVRNSTHVIREGKRQRGYSGVSYAQY